MKRILIGALVLGALAISGSAEARTLGSFGTPVKTTITHPDGSKTVIYPNGRQEVRNFDGSRRGNTKVCSNGRFGGNIVTCYYVG